MRWRAKGGMGERKNATLWWISVYLSLIHYTAFSSLSLNVIVSSSLVPVLVISVPLVLNTLVLVTGVTLYRQAHVERYAGG